MFFLVVHKMFKRPPLAFPLCSSKLPFIIPKFDLPHFPPSHSSHRGDLISQVPKSGPDSHCLQVGPTQIINILQTHFEKEHSRNTPDHIPLPLWQNPLNPDPYTNPKANTTTIQHTLDPYLTKNHYTAACHKASAGKAPGQDAIPKEILKHLPESAPNLIYHLFGLMAR